LLYTGTITEIRGAPEWSPAKKPTGFSTTRHMPEVLSNRMATQVAGHVLGKVYARADGFRS